ncbi:MULTISPECIES: esterase/lipase family protein [unclassified Streptomyces]|uniref:esterase/lipase family protein n=1 Tax=unclassified Streptomyces TaxID=2593676 RepID=UPI00369974EE
MNRTLVATAVAAAGTLLALQTSVPAQASSSSSFTPTSNPVLFVHGYTGDGSNWNTMAGRFQNDGWPSSHLDQWTYDWHQSNATTAQQLSAEVDRLLSATGATKVDIVSHSMGGLSSRYFLKNLGGGDKVDAWVSLGGPNHGTDSANSCFDTSCTEMRIGSSFLASLNSGDETPGAPRYATWWSPCDTVINPDSSVALSGAANTKTACLSHTGLLSDATVYAQVRDMINS